MQRRGWDGRCDAGRRLDGRAPAGLPRDNPYHAAGGPSAGRAGFFP